MDGAMAAYVLLEPTPSAAADAAYWAGIGELATMVVMAAEGGQIVGVSQDALDQVRYTACRGRAAAGDVRGRDSVETGLRVAERRRSSVR